MSDSLSLDLHQSMMAPLASAAADRTAIQHRQVRAWSWRDFDRRDRIAAWDALAQWAVEPNPYYESWFLLPSLSAFDPEGKVQLVVLECDGQIAGLMPVGRERSYYGRPIPHWRNWVHANCFLGQPLVARGFERVFWKEMLRWADKSCNLALFLHLAHVPGKGPLHEALVAELADHKRTATTVMHEERALLASAKSPDDYLAASLSTKRRKELRRQRRRLEELGKVSLSREDGVIGVTNWADAFLELEARGWKGEAGSALACDTRTEDMFCDVLGGGARRGRVERLTLMLDDKPIAMLANFICPPGAYSFKTAFDEDYARFSPGVLLQVENLKMLARNDVDWVDSCAAEDHPMIDHIWRERREIARHSIGIGSRARQFAFAALARAETGALPEGLQ